MTVASTYCNILLPFSIYKCYRDIDPGDIVPITASDTRIRQVYTRILSLSVIAPSYLDFLNQFVWTNLVKTHEAGLLFKSKYHCQSIHPPVLDWLCHCKFENKMYMQTMTNLHADMNKFWEFLNTFGVIKAPFVVVSFENVL